MCSIYAFFQGIYTGSDICGEDYRALIQYCFDHCSTASFGFLTRELAEELAPLHPFISRSLLPEGCTERMWLQHECYFHCNEALWNYLLSNAQSLFDWANFGPQIHPVPEDLCFYRKDGTMLFSSCTHEGECFFVLRENELPPEFVDHYGWEQIEEEHLYYKGLLTESTTPFF